MSGMSSANTLRRNQKETKRKPRSPRSALLSPFLGEGSPTKIDYRKKGTLILTSLLEDLEKETKRKPTIVGGLF